jgi:hypothetical protein
MGNSSKHKPGKIFTQKMVQFPEEMKDLEAKSQKYILNNLTFYKYQLFGYSPFCLKNFIRFSEFDVIECYNIKENHVKVLYLPKKFSSSTCAIHWVNESEILHYTKDAMEVHLLNLKFIDSESIQSKEYHKKTDFSLDTIFSEFQCEIIQEFGYNDHIKISNEISIESNIAQGIQNGYYTLSKNSRYCFSSSNSSRENIFDLLTDQKYSLKGVMDISPNGRFSASFNQKFINIYEMKTVIQGNPKCIQSFPFLDCISFISFSEDSSYLLVLSFQQKKERSLSNLFGNYALTIYSTQHECLVMRVPLGRSTGYTEMENFGNFLFFKKRTQEVIVVEIQFETKYLIQRNPQHFEDLHFVFQ